MGLNYSDILGQHEALGTYSLVGWLLIRLKERETAAKAEIEKQGDRQSQCDKQGELGLEREGQVDIPEYWLLPSRTYTDGQTDLVAGVARYRDIQTDRYGCKGCKVQEHIEKQVWLQGTETDRQVWFKGFQRLRVTKTDRQTGTFARATKVARYRDR